MAEGRRTARVYDILNAGPQRRFTVSGRLVSNCFLILYGGQKNKLFATMAADREPDGKRSFPDLTPEAVFFWFDNWHRSHPWTKRWQDRVVSGWKDCGFVGTIIDRRKRFFLGGLDITAMPNMAIQGSSASITNRALKEIFKACPYQSWGEMSGVILNVYDFIGLQVPIARQAEAEWLLNTHMPYMLEGILLGIEQKSAYSWDKL